MNIRVELALMVATLLVSARLAAVLLLSPLFAATSLPGHVRLFLVLGLAVALIGSLNLVPTELPATVGALLLAMVAEVFLGAVMAFGLFAAFGAFLLGGRILEFQMGFGVANVVDPATSAQAPLIGTALNYMAVATFFLLDGHHYLLRGIAYSFERVPLGAGLETLPLEVVVAQFGLMFVYGFLIVAPAVVALLLIDITMAVAARTMPQVNVFILSLPLKIFVGISVLALTLPIAGPFVERVYGSIFRYWEGVLP